MPRPFGRPLKRVKRRTAIDIRTGNEVRGSVGRAWLPNFTVPANQTDAQRLISRLAEDR